MDWGLIYGYTGAALGVSLAATGSSFGIGYAGMAACGLLSEDPGKFGKSLILAALPGTQGFYGFLIFFLILGKIGDLTAAGAMTPDIGLMFIAAGLPVGIAGLFSGIYQGKVGAAGIIILARKPDDFIKGVVMAALVETYAILGLLASFLIWLAIKVPAAKQAVETIN
ncbi:MAG: V-type ATP synthase subunit K [Planctomycetota bacterium]